jgi:hypothetical protein
LDNSKDERGVALMMVLWVLILLGFIALEFAYSMRTEVEVTKTFRDEAQAYYVARAGIELGRYELAICATKLKPHYRDSATGRLVFGKGDDGEAKPPPACRTFELSSGKCDYEFEAASDKLPLNKLVDPANYAGSQEMIKKFLEKYCDVEPASEEESDIALSMLDWVDEDHIAGGSTQSGGLPGLGAEDDWYKSHDCEYECKDASFESEDELSLIHGLRIERDDSEEKIAKKKKIVSAFKRYFKVDVGLENASVNPTATIFYNTTSSDVVQVAYDINWPGCMSPEEYDRQKEENGGIINDNFTARYYAIISIAIMKDSPVQRQIKASFWFKPGSDDYGTPLYWNDNYIPEYTDPNQTDGSDQPEVKE